MRFRVDGRQREESFLDPVGAYEFKDLVEQIGGWNALRVLEQRRTRDASTPTLREFTARYLDPTTGLLTGIEPGTRKGYERSAEASFLRILGEQPIDTITRADVGRWVDWQEGQPSARRVGRTVAAKTVRNYHGLLSSIMRSAVEQGLRPDNPAFKMRLTRGRRRESVFLSPAEYKTLLFFIPDYYKSLVEFLAGTGCRWGEATAVTWGDVALWAKPPTVRIDKAWKKGQSGPVLGPPKSEKANRTISMHAELVRALGEPGAAHALVFPGQLSGSHLWYGRFLTSTWNPAVKKAMDPALCSEHGLTPLTRRPTPHDLRHTHASWMIAAGIPLPYVQSRLGHEKITTTVDVYGHLVPDAHEQMAWAIASTLGSPDAAIEPPAIGDAAAIEAATGEIIGEVVE